MGKEKAAEGQAEEVTWGWMLRALASRGLEAYADSEGRVRLRGLKGAATPAVVEGLRLFQKELRHLADCGAARRVVRADTGETVAQWAAGAGVTDYERLARAARKFPGVALEMQAYAELCEGGEWRWRTFAKAGAGAANGTAI